MSDEKRILIYDDEGNVKENIPYSHENSLRPLNSNENMAVIPTGIKLASFADTTDSIVKQNVPKILRSEKGKSHDIDISGPTRHIIPQRIQQTSEVVGKIILGGQHRYGSTLDGAYYGSGSTMFFDFNYPTEFDELKLTRGDNFQILNTGYTLVDGIYKFRSYDQGKVRTSKVLGSTGSGGSTADTFTFSSGSTGFHMIRLQQVSGSTHGASASVEGCGVYSYSENIRQSRYPVINNNPDSVSGSAGNPAFHDGSAYKFGHSSARFPVTGSTGTHLSIDHSDDFTPTDSSNSVYFRLSFWAKFNSSSPGKDMVLVSQANAAGTGVYELKYTHSGANRLTFTYSTNASGSDLDNSFIATLLVSITSWNHIQVEVAPSKEVRIYVNGTLVATDAIGGSEVVFSNVTDAPFVIGARSDGSLPFEGWIDEVEMLWASDTVTGSGIYFMGGATGSTMAVGTTFAVPTGGVTGSTYTSLLFNMNGPSGCQLFTEDGHQPLETNANVVGYDDDRRILLISNYGQTGSSSSFSKTKGFVKGYDEGLTDGTPGTTNPANSTSRHPFLGEIIGITAQGANVTNLKRVLGYQQETNSMRDMFYVGMTGSSGACGDFKNLFGVAGACAAFGSRVLTFSPGDYDMTRMNKSLLSTGVGGVSLSQSLFFYDLAGSSFPITEAQLAAFQSDCSIYRRAKENDVVSQLSSIYNATTLSGLAATSKTQSISVDYSPFAGTGKLPTPSAGRDYTGTFVFRGAK